MSKKTYMVRKAIVVVTMSVVLIAPLLTPSPVQAQSNLVSSALKGIANLFSSKEEDTTEEVLITTNVFPEVEDRKPTRVIAAVMTAYSSDVGQTDASPCLPADWKYNLCEHYEQFGEQDTIAANFLPLGTKVRFPDLYGEKVFTVRDRMNARYGVGRGDIWMPTRAEAKQFGVKKVTMEIFSR
jgi:3D (Asp-Asp-Asp) domain-containing protein